MSTLTTPPLYDELVDLLAEQADPEQLRVFRLSAERQERLDDLLERNRDGRLEAHELTELGHFEQYEHIVRLLKARTLRMQSPDA